MSTKNLIKIEVLINNLNFWLAQMKEHTAQVTAVYQIDKKILGNRVEY